MLTSSPRSRHRRFSRKLALAWAFAGAALIVAACSATGESNNSDDDDGSGASGASSGQGGLMLTGGNGGGGPTGDPKTCAEAVDIKSYVGCDFWPTVTPNVVASIFDYAVVVANTGDTVVDVTVERGTQTVATAQIGPDSLGTVYLPWVPQLKGGEADEFGLPPAITQSVRVADGAYHLTSTYPVTVYQFSALEYEGVGGPPGKSWANCPELIPGGCFSFSNDASLLLPATALTGNYRVTGSPGWEAADIGPFLVVTGTADNTTVDVFLGGSGQINGGGGVTTVGPNGTGNFTINRGEVVMLTGTPTSDFTGARLAASAPVQLVSGMSCINVPLDSPACDHIEESVFPAETLGARYLVTRPTGPNGDTPGHAVRIVGNFDGTVLTYPSGAPPGAPASIAAGQVIDLGVVTTDFEIVGDQAFAVESFQLGGSIVDAAAPIGEQKGDPALSLVSAVEQFRTKYVFLAPTDYDVNYVDIIQPMTATITLDGQGVGIAPQAIGGSGYGVARVQLSNSGDGAHLLEANQPVGIQVSGYGAYTSYYYPGGLDLKSIAPPPVK